MILSQKDKLLEILADGNPHCVVELVERVHCYDYRKRLSELKKSGVNLISRPCRGACGRKHNSGVHTWEWIKETLF